MRRLLLILALAGCQCEETGVGTLTSRVRVSPRAIDFGEIFVGSTRTRTLSILSEGTAALRVESIHLDGDDAARFAIDGPLPTALAPGASHALPLAAAPSMLGRIGAELVIRTDDLGEPEIRVPLEALGAERPPCDDGNDCTEDWFDASANTCRHRFADGTPCSPADRCIVDAVCQQGVCLGRSKVCADSSPCTRDLCRQVDGECLFVLDERACEDDNPCTADLCGPSGCTNEALANGAPCDDGDACTDADACFAGRCVGTGVREGEACDDADSCTAGDVCRAGVCSGVSIVAPAAEGEVLFEYRFTSWPNAFLHRREVSMSDDGIMFALDHLPLSNPRGLTHVVSTMRQCGTADYEFSYRPPDSFVLVRYVRREMQLTPDNVLRVLVGVRQLPENGFEPQTTTYVLDRRGHVLESKVRALGGETGRSLLPDGSQVYGVVWPLSTGPGTPEAPSQQNLVIVREDRHGNVLWRHERASLEWAEFLGVAGPRVLFWSNHRFGALDFNTGATVWSSETRFIAKEMAFSTQLNLGVTRVGSQFANSQIVGVEILEGNQIFLFPAEEDLVYLPRTDPVISSDGRILVVMQHSSLAPYRPERLEWVELTPRGELISRTPLPYSFPEAWSETWIEDDPYLTVADDGVAYVGYGDQFWAIDPGGQIRWTLTSTLAHGFTGSVAMVRDDATLLISEGHRRVLGVKSNGARMSQAGWPTFRHDGRRTNFTP